jgi:hypothetical protein
MAFILRGPFFELRIGIIGYLSQNEKVYPKLLIINELQLGAGFKPCPLPTSFFNVETISIILKPPIFNRWTRITLDSHLSSIQSITSDVMFLNR